MLKLIKKRSGEAKTPKTANSKAAEQQQAAAATAQVVERAASSSNAAAEMAPAPAKPAKAVEPAPSKAVGGNGKAGGPDAPKPKSKKLESLQALRYITALQVGHWRVCMWLDRSIDRFICVEGVVPFATHRSLDRPSPD